jgi:hypothetical protein
MVQKKKDDAALAALNNAYNNVHSPVVNAQLTITEDHDLWKTAPTFTINQEVFMEFLHNNTK